MWRFGFGNPINYNDNEVFCGGFGVQYDKNGGKCGVCGDNYVDKQPREHENGGKYGNSIISRRYVVGQKMDVELDLTTNHYGWFEFKLCPVNSKTKIATQECMDKYPLKVVGGSDGTKYYIPKETDKKAILKYQVYLPPGVTCQQCVVQWTYKSGNTWGDCGNGTSAVGCGDQEMFRNCADIQIYSITGGLPPNAIDQPNAIYLRDQNVRSGRRPLVIRAQLCVPTEKYKDRQEMHSWCQTNCLSYPSNCQEEYCTCLDDCEAIGELAGIEGTDVYCHRNCLRYPSTCPEDQCRCKSNSREQTEDGDFIISEFF